MTEQEQQSQLRQQLRQILSVRFDEGELRTLAFDLDVDYDSLPDQGKANKARELVAYLERRDRILELLQVGQRLQPDILWPSINLNDRMDQFRARRDRADQTRRETRERQREVNSPPLYVQHFKNREQEIVEFCNCLSESDVRLINVVGRGGIGKTALVSHILSKLARGTLPVSGQGKKLHIDGIIYLSARETDLNLERIYSDVGYMLGDPIATMLDVRWTERDASLTDKIEYLMEAMQNGTYLIFLDDPVIQDGKIANEGLRLFIERCLTQPGGVRLIVTSRAQLDIPPGTQSDERFVFLNKGLPEHEAIDLLQILDPQGLFGLRDAKKIDLNKVIQLTYGIPRALELVAGALRKDPTTNLARLVANKSRVNEIVEQLVKSSYQDMGDNERQVMKALAVFDRPVQETAIAYLLHSRFPDLDVHSCLRQLARNYFVSVNRSTGEYHLHPLDREYVYRQISEGREAGPEENYNLELRAANFYVEIRKPQHEWQSIDDLPPQLAEFEHRIRARDHKGACRLLGTIDSDCLYSWGHHALIIELREKLLGRLTQNPRLRSINLGRLGHAYLALGEVEQAIECFTKALEYAHEAGHRRGQGNWSGNLGYAYRQLGQVEQAIQYYTQALNIARETKDRQFEAIWLDNLGSAYHITGKLEKALTSCEQALVIAREIKHHRREIDLRRGESRYLSSIGSVYRSLGQFERAITFHRDALTVAREIGDRPAESSRLYTLGNSYRSNGQFEQAIEFYQQALSITHDIGGHSWKESYRFMDLGRVFLTIGKYAEAQEYCEKAIEMQVLGSRYQAALTLGIVHLHQGNSPAAAKAFDRAVTDSRDMLVQTANLYRVRYAFATALVGEAVCDQGWAEENQRDELLDSALEEYRRALEICAAKGVIHDTLENLEMIRAANVKGLEPVFGLVENVQDTCARNDQ